MALGQRHGDVGCVINGNSEAKLLTPELVKAQLSARKHSVRCIWQSQSTWRKTHIDPQTISWLFLAINQHECTKVLVFATQLQLSMTFVLLVWAVHQQTGAAPRHLPGTEWLLFACHSENRLQIHNTLASNQNSLKQTKLYFGLCRIKSKGKLWMVSHITVGTSTLLTHNWHY